MSIEKEVRDALDKVRSEAERGAIIQAAGTIVASIISSEVNADQKWTKSNFYLPHVVKALAAFRG